MNSILLSGVKSPNEEFTSFTYPGHLAGNAFSFNSAGFTFGVNALYSNQIALSRIRMCFCFKFSYTPNFYYRFFIVNSKSSTIC